MIAYSDSGGAGTNRDQHTIIMLGLAITLVVVLIRIVPNGVHHGPTPCTLLPTLCNCRIRPHRQGPTVFIAVYTAPFAEPTLATPTRTPPACGDT
jgi:hypothetical protein